MKERSMERYQTPFKIEMSLVITFAVSVVEKRTRPNKEETGMQNLFYISMLWLNFIIGSNVIFLCFKLIMIHFHIPEQKIERQHIQVIDSSHLRQRNCL